MKFLAQRVVHPLSCQICLRRDWASPRYPDREIFSPIRDSVQIDFLLSLPLSLFSPILSFFSTPFRLSSNPSPHVVRAMSLNGLDTPAVVEAYQSALVDAGGW